MNRTSDPVMPPEAEKVAPRKYGVHGQILRDLCVLRVSVVNSLRNSGELDSIRHTLSRSGQFKKDTDGPENPS